MVLAHGIEGEAGDGHRIVCLCLEDGVYRVIYWCVHTREKLLVEAGHADRRLQEALPCRVFTDGLQNLGHRSLNPARLDRNSLLGARLSLNAALDRLGQRHRLDRLEGRLHDDGLGRNA